LFMDMGFAETLQGSKFAAKFTILISAILIFLAAIWVIQG
jgi:flagellar biogenesis protein FliO